MFPTLFAKERLLGFLPMLCLVHCVGTGVLAVLMPGAALWMNSDWLEGLLSILSALLIGTLVLRPVPGGAARWATAESAHRKGVYWMRGLFAITILLGLCGWGFKVHFLRHGSLLLLIVVQLLWLRERRTVHRQGAYHPQGHEHASCACH